MAFTFISTVLVVIIIVCTTKPLKNPQTIKCSGEWMGVGYECFYFSDDTRNWTASKTFCRSQGLELAQIDTPEDMV
ncbi:C-type lectin domain family 2 member A-like [Phyllostomus hastatus]|uniref:C-type lectin domain family 2 member A-like n=1 Tax=Phyllostomus hastatus TaxID=9423 RepID=UPI001E68288E|nr:C-type lectin domain family 2 member A-like [Phyllostomus hastatus]